ncbi:MAG TPA: ATP-binding cassette domain-containing protein [Paenirhodobacter sp.]
MRLLPGAARIGGGIEIAGQPVLGLGRRALSALRGRDVAMIFQEPMSSLNPLHSIGKQIAEAIILHEKVSAAEVRRRVIALLEQVRLPDAARRIDDYPHQFSGGQRQRVMIALAIACRPKALIADEPTTALDVTIQAEILALIDGLRRDLGMAVLLITHDLGVVAEWTDRVIVMHEGRVREVGPARQVFAAPQDDYTRGLIGASLHGAEDLHYRTRRLAKIVRTPEGGFDLSRSAPKPDTTKPGDLPLLQVQDLRVGYGAGPARHEAVRGVDFDLAGGETLWLVGESGCGKSSLSRAILGLTPASAGRIVFDGIDLRGLPRWRWPGYRWRLRWGRACCWGCWRRGARTC